MSLILIVIHIVVCVALIMIVLLQTGKAAPISAPLPVCNNTIIISAMETKTCKMIISIVMVFVLILS